MWERMFMLQWATNEENATVRWVVNPWFVGVQPDHETTDIMESWTWSQLSVFYRDFVASPNTPSGQFNIHGSPVKRFPASAPLRHISHLPDALIGQARWDDPMVPLLC